MCQTSKSKFLLLHFARSRIIFWIKQFEIQGLKCCTPDTQIIEFKSIIEELQRKNAFNMFKDDLMLNMYKHILKFWFINSCQFKVVLNTFAIYDCNKVEDICSKFQMKERNCEAQMQIIYIRFHRHEKTIIDCI